ncbi:metal-dependent hydrolase [Sphingorhabdus arenilitoris]|uniref:Metal-dependent hydrolase n=1 Tax=Sphingorhabdus arenilitoris TaxID=1490041 RepID=A0ABV8RID8_9SPHN
MQKRDFRTDTPPAPNRHWVRGDPFHSAFFNALSAVFPAGEAFMIRSIKPWQKRTPPTLAADIRNFVEQEAGHSREHDVMNDSIIAAGYDIEPLKQVIQKFIGRFKKRSALTRLGATMCIEHLTAIVAAEVMENDHHLEGSDLDLRELWIWHGLEEIEHKAVAFDAWQYAVKDWSPLRRYAVRTSFLTVVTISFLINRTRGQMELLRQDGYGFWRSLFGLMKSGFGRSGIGRASIRPWFAFFRPNFHPWDIDDRHLIAKGERLLAEIKARKAKAEPDQDAGQQEFAERRKNPRMAKAA